MRNHVVTIKDSKGTKVLLNVSTPGFTTKWASMYGIGSAREGDWSAMEMGIIKFPKGDTWTPPRRTGASANDLYIGAPVGNPKSYDGWGIILWDYEDRIGVNEMGLGQIDQSWCLAMTPGKIEWALATYGEIAKAVFDEQQKEQQQETPEQVIADRLSRWIERNNRKTIYNPSGN